MFAMIPPTRAAARTTYSGFSSEKNSFTAGVSRRSSSFFARVTMFPYPSASSLRWIAEPTIPRCPATKIFPVFSMRRSFPRPARAVSDRRALRYIKPSRGNLETPLVRWFRKHAHPPQGARGLSPSPPLRHRGSPKHRFREALDTARASYRRIVRSAPPPPGFVHPQWEENIREVESYFLERFDMSFMAHPRVDGTMVFTNAAAHEAEWPFVEAWRSPDTVRKYLAERAERPFPWRESSAPRP